MEKTLILGKIEVKSRRERQRMRWLDSFSDSMDMSLSKLQKIVEDRGAWPATVDEVSKNRHDSVTEQHQTYFLVVFSKQGEISYLDLLRFNILPQP